MLQDAWFEGMNAMVRYAFDATEIMWDQVKRTVGATLEQGGKLYRELEKYTTEWMESMGRGGMDVRRAMERSLDGLKAAWAEGNGDGWMPRPYLPAQLLGQWAAAFTAPAAEEKTTGKGKQGQ